MNTKKEIVDKITNHINIDYAGIDLIYHNGEPVFNEIEDPVGARMLYENTNIDIVEIFVKYIVDNYNAVRREAECKRDLFVNHL